MIDGFKNREVISEPMRYTAELLSGNMRREYEQTGSITLPYVEPLERPRTDYMSRDWDAHDFGSDPEDDLLDYLDMINDMEDDEL